jgi:hypothetical protein
MGLVVQDGRAEVPEALTRRLRDSSKAAVDLAVYNKLRAEATSSVPDQWALAVWCEKHGLAAEAMAHFTTVTRLDPNHEAAWKRLGCERYQGRWMTASEVAIAKAEAAARVEADRTWRPRLTTWKQWLRDAARKADAARELNSVNDPRAVPTVWSVLGTGSMSEQDWAVRILGRIDSREAAQGLATLAVRGSDKKLRAEATERLLDQDPRSFVGLLINLLRDPIHFKVEPVEGFDAPGVLWLEGSEFNTQWLYVVRPSPDRGIATNGETIQEAVPILQSNGRPANLVRETQLPSTEDVLAAEQEALTAAQRALNHDATIFERESLSVSDANLRVLLALHTVTGQSFGVDRQAWTRWWVDQLGYSYSSPSLPPTGPKPTVTQLAVSVSPRPIPVQSNTQIIRSHSACFGAGTLVRSSLGMRPIESLEVGDQVLAQDWETGSLSFQPITAVHHNPPSPTLRLRFAHQSTVVTGIHRFWRVGRGWTMARELKPGDLVRALGGVAKVESSESDAVQSVFNLDVAGHHDFFVGQDQTLVHDHTLVPPSYRVFDAVPIPSKTARRIPASSS